ncbi:replicative DNA helicase [Desulfothermus naphthae]
MNRKIRVNNYERRPFVSSPEKILPELIKRVPPHNLEAEQAVLGGILIDNSVFHTILEILKPDDFYNPAHKIIFQTFLDLYSKNVPIDLITVKDALEKAGKLEQVGGVVYLASLSEQIVPSASAIHYAEIVREKAIKRELITGGAKIINLAYEFDEDTDTLLDQAEQSIFQISESRVLPRFKSSKQLVDEIFEQLSTRYDRKALVTGVSTGFKKLDELTAGLQRTDLIIIAGRPSMGKTAFGLNIGMRAACEQNIPTAIFSLEMSMEQLMMRMLCAKAKVDLRHLRTGYLTDQDWARLYVAADKLSKAPIFIDDTPALEPLELRARCRRLKSEKGLGLVIIDYLQLMHVPQKRDSREQEISYISRNLKALAKEVDVPVVALAQLNRKVEERKDKRPMLSDLRESGAIEQDADVIIFLYRDEVYNKKEDNPKKGIAEIIIGKQRNGPIGSLEVAFLAKCTAFEDLEKREEQQ